MVNYSHIMLIKFAIYPWFKPAIFLASFIFNDLKSCLRMAKLTFVSLSIKIDSEEWRQMWKLFRLNKRKCDDVVINVNLSKLIQKNNERVTNVKLGTHSGKNYGIIGEFFPKGGPPPPPPPPFGNPLFKKKIYRLFCILDP